MTRPRVTHHENDDDHPVQMHGSGVTNSDEPMDRLRLPLMNSASLSKDVLRVLDHPDRSHHCNLGSYDSDGVEFHLRHRLNDDH